jgi:hypothetical protein
MRGLFAVLAVVAVVFGGCAKKSATSPVASSSAQPTATGSAQPVASGSPKLVTSLKGTGNTLHVYGDPKKGSKTGCGPYNDPFTISEGYYGTIWVRDGVVYTGVKEGDTPELKGTLYTDGTFHLKTANGANPQTVDGRIAADGSVVGTVVFTNSGCVATIPVTGNGPPPSKYGTA